MHLLPRLTGLFWLMAVVTCQQDHNSYGKRTAPRGFAITRGAQGREPGVQRWVSSQGTSARGPTVPAPNLDGSYQTSIDYGSHRSRALEDNQGIESQHIYKLGNSAQSGHDSGRRSQSTNTDQDLLITQMNLQNAQLSEEKISDFSGGLVLNQNIPQPENNQKLMPSYEFSTILGRHPTRVAVARRSKKRSFNHNNDMVNSLSESKIAPSIKSDEVSAEPKPEKNASYKFGFSVDNQMRNEEADSEGNVQGQYSYIDDNGVKITVEYEAGAGKGFVVKNITKQSTVAEKYDKEPGSSTSTVIQSNLNGESKKETSLNDETTLNKKQETKSIPDSKTSDKEKIQTKTESGNDGSYSFSYETPDQMREESADPNGRVRGKFSFIAQDDNKRRKVVYTADAENGFVASGSHLPIPPKPISSPENRDNSNLQNNKMNSYLHQIKNPSHSIIEAIEIELNKDQQKDVPDLKNTEGVNIPKESNDGSYYLTIDTSPNQKEKSSLQTGYVQSQIYISGNGDLQILNNKLTPKDKEFNEITTEAAPEDENETPDSDLSDNEELSPPSDVVLDVSGIRRAVAVSDKDKLKSNIETAQPFYPQRILLTASQNFTKVSPDGSYAYSYKAGDDARQQSVDSEGNMHSSYQYKTDDNTRVVVIFHSRVNKIPSNNTDNNFGLKKTDEVLGNEQQGTESTLLDTMQIQSPENQLSSNSKRNIPNNVLKTVRKAVKRKVVYRPVYPTKYGKFDQFLDNSKSPTVARVPINPYRGNVRYRSTNY